MPIRVLLADDDAAIRQMLETILAIEGAEVASCASAAEAIQQLEDHAFDLVITDMRMETPTAGFDVVRAASQTPAQPMIVILTAFPLRESDLQGHGPITVLQKGAVPNRLLDELRKILAAVSARMH